MSKVPGRYECSIETRYKDVREPDFTLAGDIESPKIVGHTITIRDSESAACMTIHTGELPDDAEFTISWQGPGFVLQSIIDAANEHTRSGIDSGQVGG